MNYSVTDWLHFGMWGMLIGSAVIGMIGLTMRKEDRHHVYLAGWITLTAATAYYAMSVEFGTFAINGQNVQFARYIDWMVTTPLLLLSLIAVGLPSGKSKQKTALIAGVIGLDVSMILTGLFASLAVQKWPWYVISCAALVLIGYMVFGVIRAEVRSVSKKLSTLYMNLAMALTLLWAAYPVVWYLAGSGVNQVSFLTENALYAILDLTAKVGFGIAILLGVKNLAKNTKLKAGEATVETVAK